MKIAIGCDHGGYLLKQDILIWLEEHEIDYEDFGCYSTESVDYPIYGEKVARSVASGECDRGIVICTTGIGISRREQGQGHPLRPLRRQPVRRDDPPPQRREHARPRGGHHGSESGQAHRRDVPEHRV